MIKAACKCLQAAFIMMGLGLIDTADGYNA